MAGEVRIAGLLVLLTSLVSAATPALAQTPRDIPQDGYSLHDERALGPFTVQRWVNMDEPEVSPTGECDCITVVYDGVRRVMTLGGPGVLTAYTLHELSGSDINGDSLPDLVVLAWSGGATCCYASAVYSVGQDVRQVLSLQTGRCGPGEFEDLDGNGTREFVTCDDQWANAFCSLEESPLPRVVYSYDSSRGEYVPDTPRYTTRFRAELARALDETQTWLSESGGRDFGLDKCRLLRPALGLMYGGRFDDGLILIRGLYRGPDREQFERDTTERVRQSPKWVEGPAGR